MTGIADLVTSANTVGLTYTAANRLATATGPWGSESFSYDAVGNRLNDNTTLGSTTVRLASYPATSNRFSGMTQNAAAFRTFAYQRAAEVETPWGDCLTAGRKHQLGNFWHPLPPITR